MKKTIFGKDNTTSDNDVASPPGNLVSVSSSDMEVNDVEGLGWLNEELPNLSTASHHHFDLEQEFDIRRYLDILADEVSRPGPVRAAGPSGIGTIPTSTVDKSGNASTVAPEASAWDT